MKKYRSYFIFPLYFISFLSIDILTIRYLTIRGIGVQTWDKIFSDLPEHIIVSLIFATVMYLGLPVDKKNNNENKKG